MTATSSAARLGVYGLAAGAATYQIPIWTPQVPAGLSLT